MTLQDHPHGAAVQAPPADEQWRRLSPRMLLIHPVREGARSLPALLGALVAGRSSGNGEWWALAVLALVVGASVARWFTTRFRISPHQVQLSKGLLRKQIITTPADRVRSVDVTASPLHRLLGLAKVEIGTGINDRQREGLVLDALPRAAAAGLRAELLHRGGRSVPAAPGTEAARGTASEAVGIPEEEPVGTPARNGGVPVGEALAQETEIVRLHPRWVAYAPFTLSGVVTGLAIVGLTQRLVSEMKIDLGRLGISRWAADRATSTPLWLDVLTVVVVLAVAVGALSLIGYVLAFWGFRLTRHRGGTLHVVRGLVTTRATSIEERRLRGVEISEPLFLRAVGGARLIAITTGLRVGRGAQRGGSMIVPPAPLHEVRRVAGVVKAGMGAAVDVPLTPHGARARRRRFTRALFGPAVLVALAAFSHSRGWWPWWPAVLAAVLVLAGPALAFDRYRSLGHAVTGGFLVARFGSLVRRRCIVEADGVIGWSLDRSFFQRRAGLATLSATTAAGDQSYSVADVPLDEAIEVAERAIPGSLRQFLVPVSS